MTPKKYFFLIMEKYELLLAITTAASTFTEYDIGWMAMSLTTIQSNYQARSACVYYDEFPFPVRSCS